jgi:hypothetical protein
VKTACPFITSHVLWGAKSQTQEIFVMQPYKKAEMKQTSWMLTVMHWNVKKSQYVMPL